MRAKKRVDSEGADSEAESAFFIPETGLLQANNNRKD